MKCFTTLQSLHQHVWHIEWISMTTLTFSGGTENCFKRMESTDPGWELRCYAKMYYMVFKSFLWNVWVYPKPSEGRHGKHVELRASLTPFLHQGSMRKKVEKRAVPSSSLCHELLQVIRNYKVHINVLLDLQLHTHTLPVHSTNPLVWP